MDERLQAKEIVQEYWNALFEKYGIEGKPPKAIVLAKRTEAHSMGNPHVLTEYNGIRFYTTLFYNRPSSILTIERLDGNEDFVAAEEITNAKSFKDLMQRLK